MKKISKGTCIVVSIVLLCWSNAFGEPKPVRLLSSMPRACPFLSAIWKWQ